MNQIRLVSVALGSGLLLVAAACGTAGASQPATAPAPVATSLPATAALPTPTPTSAPTAVPEATATTVPTATPFVLPAEEPWPDDPKAGLAVKTLPAAIRPGADEIPVEQALAIWTGWLGGSRAVAFGGSLFIDYCSDGTGHWSSFGGTGQDGAPFRWRLTEGGDWRAAIAHYEFLDPKNASIIDQALISAFYTESPVYESPRCR